ncbi:hypothetical protein [Burkholderia ubonensis]|nr:hypothetical protein [Burkholderia ubonensis]
MRVARQAAGFPAQQARGIDVARAAIVSVSRSVASVRRVTRTR